MTAVPAPTRRAVLTGAVGLALGAVAACTGDADRNLPRRPVTTGPTSGPSRDDGDVAHVKRAIADEERLLHYCTAMGARHPRTRELVRPLSTRQRAHVSALRAILTDGAPAPTTVSPRVPAGADAAIRELQSRLAAARDGRLAGCLAVSAGLLARVMASVSASHACSLTELGAGS